MELVSMGFSMHQMYAMIFVSNFILMAPGLAMGAYWWRKDRESARNSRTQARQLTERRKFPDFSIPGEREIKDASSAA